MSGRGPQSMRSSPPPAPPAANILAQDRKLHQLDVPMRAGLGGLNDATIGVGGIPVGVGSSSSSSWDDREVARQIAMLTEERDFLRKYVSRCEHELKAYQLQYPDLVGGHTAGGANSGDILNELSGGTGIEELPPWIGQAKYMSPLLVAYEARIEELMEKNQEQLHDFSDLKRQYDDLHQRNKEAEAELENNIKNLLTHIDQQKGSSNAHGPLDEDEVSELQEQVSLYKEQVDILNSQKLELESEVAKTSKLISEARSERDIFWTNEVKKLQNALGQVRIERDKFKNTSSSLTQSQMDLSNLQKEHSSLQKKFLATQVQLEQVEKESDRLLEQERLATSSLKDAERDLESLLKTLSSMETAAQEARQREVAQVRKESELLEKAESARLEKDQALLREQALRADLKRLEQRAEDDLASAHRKHDDDLATLFARNKDTEAELNRQITELGLLLTEAEVARDQSRRECKTIQDTSEKILSSTTSDLTNLRKELGRSQELLQQQQVEQEDLKMKRQRAEEELNRCIERAEKERKQLQELISSLKLKNDSLVSSNQFLTSSQSRSEDHLQRVERELLELKRISEGTIGRLQNQLNDVEQVRKSQTDELKMRLEEAYRMHERSDARATELLASQDLLADKWRTENKAIRTQLTQIIQEEKSSSDGLQKRCAELETRVGQLVRERDQAMQFQQQYENLKKSHELTVVDLTHRLHNATHELSQSATREADFQLLQKQLQTKVDRYEIELKRCQRQYEQARKKAEFLEGQLATSTSAVALASARSMPLQPALGIMNQATGATASGAPTDATTTSTPAHLQPIPVPQSLLPPAFAKRV